jgi:hypothetical protein
MWGRLSCVATKRRIHTKLPHKPLAARSAFPLVLGVTGASLLWWWKTKVNTSAEEPTDTTVSEHVISHSQITADTAGKFAQDLPIFTEQDITQHRNAGNRVWVTYREGVYDITDFIESHPGFVLQKILLIC